MDASTLLTLTQTLVHLIEFSGVKDIKSIWSFRSQLSKLSNTITTINAVLRDEEEQQRQQLWMTNTDREWLDKIREAVFQADDLLDEVASVARRKQLMKIKLSHGHGHKLISKKVGLFFSRFNQLAFAFNVSREIKKIRERLDDIAKDRRDIGFQLHQHVNADQGRLRMTTIKEMRSLVHVNDVIGRDGDKKAVIHMLLDCNIQEDIQFITIVGIGGLGKTTLAKLVYNDESIQREFPLKLWVCVSEDFHLEEVLCKLLEAVTNHQYRDAGLESLERQFRENFKGKKYLLVLDDVWNENLNRWLQLKDLLTSGARGSRVLVTTRSKVVAKIVGGHYGSTLELKGLSSEDSWRLFKRMAFQNDERVDNELVEIGGHIVKKCCNVPLAVRVVGSLLYGQSKSTWQSFRDMDLASMLEDDNNGIIPILKLSYHHLEPHLRRCFSYCALFPKGFVIDKVMLIHLWMAHSFIQPLKGQSAEDSGEEHFMALVQRGFFQEVKVDGHADDIVSCKIHDLMHDLAQEVARNEISVLTPNRRQCIDNTRHLSIDCNDIENVLGTLANMSERMRTFLLLGFQPRGLCQSWIDRIITSKVRYLRVLCLKNLDIRSLPISIGELIHLRFLDLSGNDRMEFLPASLTKLINLQTLSLSECSHLKELPSNFNKLVNLRHLYVDRCDDLRHMPQGMNKMTCLQTLTMFVINETSQGSRSKQGCTGQLKDLASLTKLKGTLEIKHRKFETARVKEAGYIVRDKEHLKALYIEWVHGSIPNVLENDGEALLEGFQPHPNLKAFGLVGFPSERLVGWASSESFATSLANLVKVSIRRCTRLQQVPSLGQLRYLKVLSLFDLTSLEYIETTRKHTDHNQESYFPSLEKLELLELPKLKRWWISPSGDHDQSINAWKQSLDLFYAFPRLSELEIDGCPNLTTIPLSTNLQKISLYHAFSSSALSESLAFPTTEHHNYTSSSNSRPSWKLKNIRIDKVGLLNYLPAECFECLSELTICGYDDVGLSIIEKVFQSCLSVSLQSLAISSSDRLKSLRGAKLEHLTTLEKLELAFLPNWDEVEDENHMPWRALHSKLRHLQFVELPKLVKLPQGIQHLTSLESLYLFACDRLQDLPDGMSSLKSLQSLAILGCPLLKDRCRDSTGEDWPKIQHIPHIAQYYGEEEKGKVTTSTCDVANNLVDGSCSGYTCSCQSSSSFSH